METTTYTLFSVATEEEHTATLIGLDIAGTLYPSESPIGIGVQLGFAKAISATRGSSDQDVEDYPLTWNGGITGEFMLPISEVLALELGGGLSYEYALKIFDIGSNSDIETTLNTLTAIASANLVFHLSDPLTIVGGIGASLPLATKAKFELSSISYTEDVDVSGFTVKGKIGMALGF